ncbi:MAG: uridine kinase [Chlamydiota bacterium]
MYHFLFAVLFFCIPLMLQAKLVIGIAGGTGSGKTTLAEKLLDTFSDRAVLIQQDAYYKDLPDIPLTERAKNNYDHPNSIDFDLLEEHIQLLRQDQSVESPVYNFAIHAREKFTKTINSADIIIIEGILLFSLPEIRNLCDLKIFVETDDDVRLLRRIQRDMRERARDFLSIRDQYLKTVKPMHDAFVEPSKRYADIIIPTLVPNDTGLALIVSSLKKDYSFLTEKGKESRLAKHL